jgi:hypothetical protein
MRFRKSGHIIGLIVFMAFGVGSAWALETSKEIRPASQMNGFITTPLEEGKQALSAGDKVMVSLEQFRPVKKGDRLEIFQPVGLPGKEHQPDLLSRVGQGIVLEVAQDGLLLCVIVSSIREVGAGDRIYWP